MRTTLIQAGLLLAGAAVSLTAAAVDWPQFGCDATHSGSNPFESAITPSNVASLVPLYAAPVTLPATVDSAPVYASGVTTAGGVRNLLFLLAVDRSYGCSQTGTLLAIDAADGSTVWSKQTTGCQPVTASPAIDPGDLFVYSYGLDGKAHKYQIGDGTEIVTGGWPEVITLKSNVEKGASGLTIAGNGAARYLAVVTDGYIGDQGNYQGHLVSINLATGAQVVFNAMCSDQTIHFSTGVNDCAAAQSGIWGRGGATFNPATNRVYIATGNGQFNANSGGFNWGDSVLALAPDGTGAGAGLPRDSYTPTNYQSLQDSDSDLGSTSLAILPAPAGSAITHLGMQVGKDFRMRLINLDNMSGAGAPGHVGGELQLLPVPQGGGGMREQPAVWVNPANQSTWVFVANVAGISGIKLGLNVDQPRLVTQWTKTTAATSPVIAHGVLYSASACTGGTCVVARNPTTGDLLWTSPFIGGVHWQSPIIVDGAVYITDNNAKLWKFGLNQPADLVFRNGFDG